MADGLQEQIDALEHRAFILESQAQEFLDDADDLGRQVAELKAILSAPRTEARDVIPTPKLLTAWKAAMA